MNYEKLTEIFNEHNAFTHEIGIEMTEIKEDFATAKIPFAEHITNRSEHVHGGIYVSLADTVSGGGSLKRWHVCDTKLSFQFYKATKGETIYGTATVRHRGKKTCIAATELTHADGTIVGDGLFSSSNYPIDFL